MKHIFNTHKNSEDKIIDILMCFSDHKASDFADSSLDHYRADLAKKLRHARDCGLLEIVLPGFPYKSANHRHKTLSHLPDLGEDIALRRLEHLRKKISKASGLPVKLIIASDGFAFNDLKGVSDKNVIAYGSALRTLAAKHSDHIKIKRLSHLLPIPFGSIHDHRDYLTTNYGRNLDDIRTDILKSDNLATLYTHLSIFAKHDLMRKEGESKKAFKARSKDVALHVMARSEAWAGLIEDCYPNALRLSIHPYKDVSKKFPVRLLESIDGRWRTPWHNAPVVTGAPPFKTSVKLAPRKWALENGAVMGDDPDLACMIDKHVDLYNKTMTYAALGM